MASTAHDDVRKLLKEFGVSADETVMAYLLEKKPSKPLRLRLILEDATVYDSPPAERLRLEVSGVVTPDSV